MKGPTGPSDAAIAEIIVAVGAAGLSFGTPMDAAAVTAHVWVIGYSPEAVRAATRALPGRWETHTPPLEHRTPTKGSA